MVYQLLNDKGMCTYYSLNSQPGTSQHKKSTYDKFAFLQDTEIQQQLISFKDSSQTHVIFYLPQVHCSSCLWLLENLPKLNKAIIQSKMNFPRKEVHIIFDHKKISLKELAELLTAIGYEPYISLQHLKQVKPGFNRALIYRLGVAGFCFANIMLLSFPEYLGMDQKDYLQPIFRVLNLLLALPVFFYSSQPFFITAWKGFKHRFLHIDAPIALAILVTFCRSVYEVATNTGSGYFDSMSGIVFFMLAGRVLQSRTQQQLSFERDYKDYFPVAVTVLKNDTEVPVMLPDLKYGDIIKIHHEELIPADGILTKGQACIDYSFVTGESIPVVKEMGEIIYAGGRQTGGAIELLVVKEVAQSYLTSLWDREDVKTREDIDRNHFVHLISRYFSFIVFAISIAAGIYWQIHNPSLSWNAVTAVLIVACPCALLLSSSFSNGNVMRILSRNKLYLRNADVIERMAGAGHIVFDKTGTLTSMNIHSVTYTGERLLHKERAYIYALASHSRHPLSRALMKHLEEDNCAYEVQGYREQTGYGIEGIVDENHIMLGSEQFVTGNPGEQSDTRVYISIENNVLGYFSFANHYRKGLKTLINWLEERFLLSVVSGDNNSELERLSQLTKNNATLLFNKNPQDKLHYIEQLQQQGQRVMMIGDGLNDAGALSKSDAGIAITENINNFTPASDAIMESSSFQKLPRFIQLCQINRSIIVFSFIISIIYNIAGLVFAVSGTLSPLIAAILMPASSITIFLLTFSCSNLVARKLKL